MTHRQPNTGIRVTDWNSSLTYVTGHCSFTILYTFTELLLVTHAPQVLTYVIKLNYVTHDQLTVALILTCGIYPSDVTGRARRAWRRSVV